MRLGLACLILVTGCDLYFDGDDDPPCAFAAEVAPAQELRDPSTGQCVPFGSGGCGDSCGPCALDLAPPPDWGSCFAGCESLDEFACIAEPRCRAAYDANSTTDEGARFMECWSIAPSGPAPGSCEGLDAYECSRHDNCSAFYDDDNGFLVYAACRPEVIKDCITDDECGEHGHCSTSDGDCLPNPHCPDGSCPAVCYGKCVSDGDVCSNVSCSAGSHCEAQCHADGTCDPVCAPDQNLCTSIDCGPGFECVETCQGEDPNNPGCGICDASCMPVGTCESLTTEPACVGRADCTAVYTGEDCTCYSNGTCDCEVLTYARCEAK